MPTAAELQQMADEARQKEEDAQKAQADSPDFIVPEGRLMIAAAEIAKTFNELISQIGLQFGENGEMLVPQDSGKVLDVAYKIWYTTGKARLDQLDQKQRPEPRGNSNANQSGSQRAAQQRQSNGNDNGNSNNDGGNNRRSGGRQARVGGGRRNKSPNPNGRSAFCSCDHRCSMEYENNEGLAFVCGCSEDECQDETYGGACNCIRRDGEYIENINGKWRWMPEAA